MTALDLISKSALVRFGLWPTLWIVRMGSGGCDAVSQYWNMLACSLG